MMNIQTIVAAFVLLVTGSPAFADSSQCGFIKDQDQQAYCRAINGAGQSQCGFIRSSDLQARCRAETGGGSSQCGFIKDFDSQAACRASVSEVVQVAQAAAIILNLALSRTLTLVLTAVQPMATVVVSAVSSGPVTFRLCVVLKQGVEQHSVDLSKIGICKLRAGQRPGADLA